MTTEAPRERSAVTEALERLWGQALLAVSNAEEETARLAAKLAQLAGWGPDEVMKQGRAMAEQLVAQRRELETRMEEGARAMLQRFRVPRREQVHQLMQRLDEAARRLDVLEAKRRGSKH